MDLICWIEFCVGLEEQSAAAASALLSRLAKKLGFALPQQGASQVAGTRLREVGNFLKSSPGLLVFNSHLPE